MCFLNKVLFLPLVFLLVVSCARQLRHTDEESGRVGHFFQMDEKEVRGIYIKNGFSWDKTIKELFLLRTTDQSSEVPEEFSDRLEPEIEKIKKECLLQ
ncbi:MAG: hypothetical protein ABIJ15_06685 [bacterium]